MPTLKAAVLSSNSILLFVNLQISSVFMSIFRVESAVVEDLSALIQTTYPTLEAGLYNLPLGLCPVLHILPFR